VVPIAVFGIAWRACESIGYRDEVFVLAGLVGVTSVICGSILAAKSFDLPTREETLAMSATSFQKPTMDADAYDVTGARG
jgi:hydrogenase/urease accessory protein HupE